MIINIELDGPGLLTDELGNEIASEIVAPRLEITENYYDMERDKTDITTPECFTIIREFDRDEDS